MGDPKISKILNKLLAEQNLRVSELARRVQLPQPTVQRIASGACASPHISSLQPIANFFAITVDQLKGLEPIAKFDSIARVPLLSWPEAAQWSHNHQAINNEYVITDINVSKHAYALKVLDGAMDPVFPRNTLLIVDPEILPKDRSYIISLIQGSHIPIFRQLIINGGDKFLKPLSPDTEIYKMTRLEDIDNILATLVQARKNYLE